MPISTYSVQDCKNDLIGILHGTSISDVINLTNVIDRAARQVLADVDPQETKQKFLLPIFDGITEYPLPQDLKGNKIIDIRPITERTQADNFSQFYNNQFDLYKFESTFTFEYDRGERKLRAKRSPTPGVKVNSMDAVVNPGTGGGTWVASGDVINLDVDKVNYTTFPASLVFDASGTGSTLILTNSTMIPFDLTTFENQGAMFIDVLPPDANLITSIQLKWGSDSLNYWTRTVTSNQVGNSFQRFWNNVAFNWRDSSVVGAPVVSNITYVQITINYVGGATQGWHVDNLATRKGLEYEILYYSKFIYQDSVTGNMMEKMATDNDLIMLDTDSYNLFLWKTAEYIAQQTQAEDAGFDVGYFQKVYTDSLLDYRAKYKSEIKKPKSIYYRQTNNSSVFFDSRFNSQLLP